MWAFKKFYKVLVSSYLIDIYTRSENSGSRDFRWYFQNCVRAHSLARPAFSCFVNKRKISLLLSIIPFVQINANFCYWLLKAVILKCVKFFNECILVCLLQCVPFLFWSLPYCFCRRNKHILGRKPRKSGSYQAKLGNYIFTMFWKHSCIFWVMRITI